MDGVQHIIPNLFSPYPTEQTLTKTLLLLWYIWKVRNDQRFQRKIWTSLQVHRATEVQSKLIWQLGEKLPHPLHKATTQTPLLSTCKRKTCTWFMFLLNCRLTGATPMPPYLLIIRGWYLHKQGLMCLHLSVPTSWSSGVDASTSRGWCVSTYQYLHQDDHESSWSKIYLVGARMKTWWRLPGENQGPNAGNSFHLMVSPQRTVNKVVMFVPTPSVHHFL
jgi:hypothetical protein